MQAGRNTTLRESPIGRSVSDARTPAKWAHPWTTSASYGPGGWFAQVKPGFVNHECPVVRTTQREQDRLGGGFRRDLSRVITATSGGAEIARAAALSAGGSRSGARGSTGPIDIPLYMSPALPLSFRAVGSDGSPQFPVPKFFADRGVAEPPEALTAEALEAGDLSSIDPRNVPANRRLLRACDVWLHQPRLALTSDITLHDGPATGISNVRQTLSLRSAAPGDVLRVQSGTFRALEGIDALGRVYEEPNYDELPIATVYLLSGPGAENGSEPDGTWQPFVRHNLFWNLNYQTPWFRQYGGDPTIPFLPPLAGGAATLITNFLVASLNDALQDALNLVTSHSMAGTFYTPTCGGHHAALPAATSSASTAGLDKTARIAADSQAKARARREGRLDPDYPFLAEPFDPALLTQTT